MAIFRKVNEGLMYCLSNLRGLQGLCLVLVEQVQYIDDLINEQLENHNDILCRKIPTSSSRNVV